jgi:hypothetical protein
MSGREKRPPATPAEERAMMRALIRELHEGTQDARTVMRELAEERAQLMKDLRGVVNEGAEVLGQLVAGFVDQVTTGQDMATANVVRLSEMIQQEMAGLAGYQTPEQFGHWLAHRVIVGLAGNESFRREAIDGLLIAVDEELKGRIASALKTRGMLDPTNL